MLFHNTGEGAMAYRRGQERLDRRERRRLEERRVSALYRYEAECYHAGSRSVAGVDEAGRGPLAGPVVAAAVILPPFLGLIGLNDSKLLSPAARERLAKEIRARAVAWGVGTAGVGEIDRLNIRRAALLAMNRAVRRLGREPDFLLVDGRDTLPEVQRQQLGIIRGDGLSASIAAASILAKVTRDQLMLAYDRLYPVYGFARHKGYPTREHREAIAVHGLSPIHRRSFHWQKK